MVIILKRMTGHRNHIFHLHVNISVENISGTVLGIFLSPLAVLKTVKVAGMNRSVRQFCSLSLYNQCVDEADNSSSQ